MIKDILGGRTRNPTPFKSNPSPMHLLSFKAEENHRDSKAFVPTTQNSNYRTSSNHESIWSGTNGNKSTSEALSTHRPRGKAFAKHKTSPSRGQGDSEGRSFTHLQSHTLGLSCLELLLLS